jgi:hypothetical protein
MSTVERIYRRLEAWGYPLPAIDWLRRHRLPVIVILAAISWVIVVAVLFGLYRFTSEFFEIVATALAAWV